MKKNIVKYGFFFLLIACSFFFFIFPFIKNYNIDVNTDSEEYAYDDLITEARFAITTYDIGKVTDLQMINNVFVCENIGASPLIIYYVSTGCSCTKYTVSKRIVQVGESATINVHFDPKDKSEGEFLEKLTIRMNTRQKYYELFVRGNIIHDN